MNPVCQPIIAGAPSVVTDTSFSSSTFFSTKNSFTALQMSTPLVVVFRGSSVKSSSFVEKLSKIIKKNKYQKLSNTPDKDHLLRRTAAVHRLDTLDAKPPAPHQVTVQLAGQVPGHRWHSSYHCSCPQLNIGESGDYIGSMYHIYIYHLQIQF